MADFYPFADLLRGFRQQARISQQPDLVNIAIPFVDTSTDVAEIARSICSALSDERALLRA